MKLLIQSIDDLWHLYNIIDKDDRISGLTYRREEARPDKLRAERGEKKRMRLTIEVNDIEFHEFSDRLRVHGIITEGYQDIGSYHTFNLSIGDIIDITKIWGDYHLQRIEDAVDATKQPLITFIAMEDGDATFAQLRQYGVEEIAHITAHTPGKQYPSKKDEKKDFYKEVLNKLEPILNGLLILLGPGFAKEEFLDFGKSRNPDLFTNCYVAAAGNAGMAGIQEVLKKGIWKRSFGKIEGGL
jgi:protein pelota